MKNKLNAPVRCAVIGYGPAHNFGRAHGRWIDATPDLQWIAVCDKDPERLKAANDEFPHLEIYANVTEMLANSEIEMVSIVTPHFTHAPVALECMRAGKHVVVDNAMCLSVAEATLMIEEAKKDSKICEETKLEKIICIMSTRNLRKLSTNNYTTLVKSIR